MPQSPMLYLAPRVIADVFAVKGYQYSFEHSLHTFAVKVKIVYYIKDGTFRLASQFSKRD